MKFFGLLLMIIQTGFSLQAQNQGPLPLINRQMIDYFNAKPREKIFIETDKTRYKPGETIWFRVFATDGNNLPDAMETCDLLVKLFDSSGKVVVQDLFRQNHGSASGEIEIPVDLPGGICFLCALTSMPQNPEDVPITVIRIDPAYNNQWIAETLLKDSSFKPGNEPGESRDMNLLFDKKFDVQLAACLRSYSRKFALMDHKAAPDPVYFSSNEMLFRKPAKTFNTNSTSLENQRKMLQSSSSILDVIKTIKPYHIVNNMIVFFGSENSLNYQGGALIVLDGQQMGTDISALSIISPAEVDHINVSTNPMDIQKYTGFNSVGVIEIFLKNAKPKEEVKSKGKVSKYDGKYRIPEQFPADPSNARRDDRTTLQWIPEQKVGSSGEFEFSVTAGNVLSDFIIVVQGQDENGRPGRGEARFSVVK